jgi:hypothetical protein
MNYIRHQTGLFERFAEDERISPFHISLYFALFQFWNRNRFRNPFPISREELMFLSRIGSINTYTRCIKQLHLWGYIEYIPSFNPAIGSKVSCISFEKGGDKGTDKGGDNAADRGLFKNTNITNGTKQAHSKIFKNGREKKSNRKNPLHVNIDKDYSEPL